MTSNNAVSVKKVVRTVDCTCDVWSNAVALAKPLACAATVPAKSTADSMKNPDNPKNKPIVISMTINRNVSGMFEGISGSSGDKTGVTATAVTMAKIKRNRRGTK